MPATQVEAVDAQSEAARATVSRGTHNYTRCNPCHGAGGSASGAAADRFQSNTWRWSIGPLISWEFPNVSATRARMAGEQTSARAALARFTVARLQVVEENPGRKDEAGGRPYGLQQVLELKIGHALLAVTAVPRAAPAVVNLGKVFASGYIGPRVGPIVAATGVETKNHRDSLMFVGEQRVRAPEPAPDCRRQERRFFHRCTFSAREQIMSGITPSSGALLVLRVGLTREQHCSLPLTQRDLADALSLSSVHVNRVLRQLRIDGLLNFHQGQLEVVDPDALRTAAAFDSTYLHLPAAGGPRLM
jgi:hypothetical protein